jgi:uncharacterized membrane protein (UPF0127 family)
MIKRGNQVISEEEIHCKTKVQMGRGLMFRFEKKNLIMYLTKEMKAYLHMFFVFYPITVLLLDKNKKVIEIKERFYPFTEWHSKNKGNYIIELSKNHPELQVGDHLDF